MKPSVLPIEYLDLAMKRAIQEDGGEDTDKDDLGCWFFWGLTPEKHDFWEQCDKALSIDELPPIPEEAAKDIGGAITIEDDRGRIACGKMIDIGGRSGYQNEFGRSGGPEHYSIMKIEPSEYIIANDMSWCEANVIKYVSRHKQKGGESDIRKAIDYLEEILANEYNNGEN